MRRRLRARWLLVLLLVAAVHLLLLLLVPHALHGPVARSTPAPAPMVLVWVKRLVPPPPEPARPAAEARAPRPVRTPPQPAISAEPPALQAQTPSGAASTAAPATEAAASAATAAASAPGSDLLGTEASRRAIRETARQRSTGEMGALATGERAPISEQDKMGQEIARGARGDCLKGDYAGAGMGLLSLPFWLIAELRDKCRR